MNDHASCRRIAILGPPSFWRAAFKDVRMRGGRVVRLLSPHAGVERAQQLDALLADLRTGRLDEVMLDLLAS
jgi:hypothetical protein